MVPAAGNRAATCGARMIRPRRATGAEKSARLKWVVYVVECADGSLYTGITKNLERRLDDHTAGRGAKYTKTRRPVLLRYREYRRTKGAALKREAAIKALTRSEKLALIASEL